MRRGIGRWPILSGPNRDGSTHIGLRVLPDAAAQLNAAGFVVANKMYERSVDSALVADVRVGDVLDVRYDGQRGWWVVRDDSRVGCLTWSMSSFGPRGGQDGLPRIDEGTMQIIRLTLDKNARVVNAGGIVRPLGAVVPPISEAVPTAQVYVPTVRATVGTNGDITVEIENVTGSARAGSEPFIDARQRKTLWSRLAGR